jgi:hypothetical protein
MGLECSDWLGIAAYPHRTQCVPQHRTHQPEQGSQSKGAGVGQALQIDAMRVNAGITSGDPRVDAELPGEVVQTNPQQRTVEKHPPRG